MPGRLPNKGDIIFAHLDDGDYVGLIKSVRQNSGPVARARVTNSWYDVHWLIRPEEPISVYDHSQMLKMISDHQIKVLDNDVLGTNIDFPRYGVGDLLISETSKGQMVGYILRTLVKGHEVRLPDNSRQHSQFFYTVSVPKQRIREQASDGAILEYLSKGSIAEIPEVLIDYGIRHETVRLQRRKQNER